MIKIATWNINSIRTRLPQLLNWLETQKPDIVLLQELKCVNEQFPRMEIEDLGYNIAIHGQKSYNGVAILSKFPLDDISSQMPPCGLDHEARYIEAVAQIDRNNVFRVASVYVPNGGGAEIKFSNKLAFLDALYLHIKKLLSYDEMLVVGGDFNVAPEEIDVYDAKHLENEICFLPEERKRFRKILNLGMIDSFRHSYPDTQEFSWWDYRAGSWQKNQGMRIDCLLLSPEAADKHSDTIIYKQMRSEEKASDHAPVIAEFKI